MTINFTCDAARRWGQRRLRRLLCAALIVDAIVLGTIEARTQAQLDQARAEIRRQRLATAHLAGTQQRVRALEARRRTLQRQRVEREQRRHSCQRPLQVLQKLEPATPPGVALQEVFIDAGRCRILGQARSPELALRLAATLAGVTVCPARGMAARDTPDPRLSGYAFLLTTERSLP